MSPATATKCFSYASAWAVDGEILRGHSIGDGEHSLQIGDPTEAELVIHGHSPEDTVLAIADAWSLNPATLEGASGLYGSSPEGMVPPKVAAAARACIADVRRKRGF